MLLWPLSSCGSDGGSEPDVPVATVTVTPGTTTIAPEATVQLQATARDASGATLTDRQVTWSSSDNDVATVSSAGLVTGVAVGSVTITARSEGKSGGAIVEVEVPVASVVISPTEVTIDVAETVQLNVATLDAEGNELTERVVDWASSDLDIATVSETGLVTGVAEGTVTITATSEGLSGSAAITVGLVSVAGHWTMDEEVSDDALGYSCQNFQDITLNQTGSTFTGTNVQIGSCTFGGETFDNSDTYDITEGQIVGTTITFTESGAVPCVYEGTVDPGIMAGTVSCQGSVDGTEVNATGTWCATQVQSLEIWSGARVIRFRRIPDCG
jgi:uncharacterized protein YjdB